jgi:hypothetical protein
MRRNPHQRSTEVSAAPYNHLLGRAPFGAPAVLNHNIVRNAVLHSNNINAAAPFELHRQQQTINHQTNPLGGRFNRYKYCWKCGFRKKMHLDYGREYGDKCSDNNLREECAKCLQRLDLHTSCGVGPYCTFPPNQNSEFVNWYKSSKRQRGEVDDHTSNII